MSVSWNLRNKMVDDIFNPPKMAAACREYFSALTSAISSWTSGRSCENPQKVKDLSVQNSVQTVQYYVMAPYKCSWELPHSCQYRITLPWGCCSGSWPWTGPLWRTSEHVHTEPRHCSNSSPAHETVRWRNTWKTKMKLTTQTWCKYNRPEHYC